MTDDRLDKLHAMGQAALGIAQALNAQVTARTMTREQAIAQLRSAVHAIHFDAGAGYILSQTLDPDPVIAHGGNPELDGKPLPAKDMADR